MFVPASYYYRRMAPCYINDVPSCDLHRPFPSYELEVRYSLPI